MSKREMRDSLAVLRGNSVKNRTWRVWTAYITRARGLKCDHSRRHFPDRLAQKKRSLLEY